jgi:cysteine desulfuration protein SufE
MPYPAKLQEIVQFFESLPEEAKRETLIHYSEGFKKYEPPQSETFDIVDVRKDEECADTVGVFLKVSPEERIKFYITLGPQVQTLTKAMTTILSKGLEGSTIDEVLKLESDFVPKIIGGELVRARSQTVYYVLNRIKGICKVWLKQKPK